MFSGVVTGDIQKLIETSSRLSKVSTRKQSEASIHKQLAAFERLLQHAMSRFSNETLYHVLRRVTKWAESDRKPPHKHATKVAFKLRSVNQLREIMDSMRKKVKSKTPEEEHSFKHYELFLNDLLYLRDLKKYFDDEIHKELTKYHLDISERVLYLSKKHANKTEDEDSGHGSQAETDDTKQVRDNRGTRRQNVKMANDTDLIDAEMKYKQTVDELQSILRKWEGLLSEDDLNLNDFDPDSYHELMQFSDYSQFETILRLVPDIFAKCYKCIDLAKTWLKLSNIVMKEPPRVPSPILPTVKETPPSPDPLDLDSSQSTQEFVKQVQELQFQIENMDKSIKDDVTQLEKYTREMNDLIGRDERFTTVSSDFSQIDNLITIAAGDYQKSKTEQYAVARKIKSCPRDNPAYLELKFNLKRLDSEVAQHHWKLRLLEFEKTTVQEDYLVEMEVRPSFIRFVGDTKQRIQEIEIFLEAKKDEKIKLEKQLALLKTNEERMRKIMRSYLGSASTSVRGNETLTRDSTELSTPSDPEDLSQLILGDGNEADDDYSSPFSESQTRDDVTRPHSVEDYILQKPKLVKADKLRVRDLRPSSEKLNSNDSNVKSKPKPVANVKYKHKGPKAALKTTPRRVWEDV